MDLFEQLERAVERTSDDLQNIRRTFEEDAADFEGVFIRGGSIMFRPRLRKTPESAVEYDMKTKQGRFLLEREVMLERAFEALGG